MKIINKEKEKYENIHYQSDYGLGNRQVNELKNKRQQKDPPHLQGLLSVILILLNLVIVHKPPQHVSFC